MRNFLKSRGSIIISLLIGYILWSSSYLFIKWGFTVNIFWLIVACLFIGSFMFLMITFFGHLLVYPILKGSTTRFMRYLNTLILAGFCINSIRSIWRLNFDYNEIELIKGVIYMGFCMSLYFPFLSLLHDKDILKSMEETETKTTITPPL